MPRLTPEEERNEERRRWRRHWVERARQLFFFPTKRHSFLVVTAAYRAGDRITKTLQSVAEQRYPCRLVRHVVIDDASPDDTAEVVRRWRREARPRHDVELQVNDDNLGGCANYTRGFRAARPEEIVLQLDGDDWLPDRGLLGYLNLVYHDPEVWMTYNSWRTPEGKPALHNEAIPAEIFAAGRLRDIPWRSSHLHSFRARLFAHVRDESLIDPVTGTWWRYAVDQAHYLPMLELAGARARHLERFTYVYHLNEGSVVAQKKEQQLDCERRIRALPPYQPLSEL